MIPRRARIGLCLVAATLMIVAAGTRETSGYALSGPTWAPGPVVYYVNTTNLDLPDAVIPPAVAVGADAWSTQSRASFRFQYGGTSTVTTNANDGVNVVM